MSKAVPRTPRGVRWHKQSGAALLVILLIVLTFGIGALLQRANQGGDSTFWGRREASTDALQRAREALIGYALTYRDRNANDTHGYFPCPDTTGDGEVTALDQPCNASSRAAIGLLPYRTLGLPDLRDADGNCLWYAVSGAYKDNPKGTTTPGVLPTGWAPLPLNWDTQGQFRIVDADDNVLTAPDDANGGAAVVIFAPGNPRQGQTRTPLTPAQTCGADPSQITAYLDEAYRNDPAILAEAVAPNFNLASAQTPANLPITVRQGPRRDAGGNLTNNDLVAWITPREVFDRIAARSDVPDTTLPTARTGLINKTLLDVAAILESRVFTDIDNGVGATASRPEDAAGAFASALHWVGTVPAAYGTDILMSTGYQNILTNWSENIRLATCKSLSGIGPGCLAMGSTTCRAGVFFSGRQADGRPRPQGQHAPTNANLDFGFENSAAASPGALEILKATSATFPPAGKTRYSDDPAQSTANRMLLRAADAGMCVMPADVSYVSLRATPAAFVPGIARTNTEFPEARVNVANKTIVLGSPGGDDPGAGCVWFPQAIPFKSSFRAYFRVQVLNRGEGMTFAIADADPLLNPAPNAVGRSQIMCGGAGSFLGYGGPPVGSTTMGIVPPKLAVEIDTRSTGSLTDPSSDHLSFMYWGTMGDNGTSGPGLDDSAHGMGSNTPSEPRNPRFTSGGAVSISAASWSGGIVTIDTSANHGLFDGDTVAVSGVKLSASATENVYDAGYNGLHRIAVVDASRFTYPLSAAPGSARLPLSGSVSNAGIHTVSGPYFSSSGVFPLYVGSTVPENSFNEVAGVVHMRIEISKRSGLSQGSHLFSFRLYAGDIANGCSVEGYANLTRDLSDICPLHRPQLIQIDVPIADNATVPAMDSIYMGFTNGQTGTRRQEIVISNFRARVQ